MEKNTREITGMKIDRKRPGRKVQEVPKRISFFNEAGVSICGITIYPELGMINIHPRGAEVTVFESAKQPLRTQENNGTRWVSNNKYGEIIFPEASEK